MDVSRLLFTKGQLYSTCSGQNVSFTVQYRKAQSPNFSASIPSEARTEFYKLSRDIYG